jgi:ribose-phosphate pyrophosphokinase
LPTQKLKQMVFSGVKLLSGTGSKYLAESIADHYGQELGNVTVNRFSDGEFQPVINESVRGEYVFIIQSTFQPHDNLMELLMLIDASKRASAQYITVVMPYFGYARQDRKDRPRVSIASKLVANLLTAAGADRIMTMDLHADQIQGFFDIPMDHLFGSAVFVPYVKSIGLEDILIAAPDVGSTKRARFYAQQLNCDMVICDKYRKRHNEIAEMNVIGDVTDKNVVLVDDIIDTGNTLCKAAQMIMEKGAKSVRAMCTHPVLSGKAYENVANSVLTELVVTDTIPLGQKHEKIKVLSVAKLFSTAIRHTHEHKSINSLFIKNI